MRSTVSEVSAACCNENSLGGCRKASIGCQKNIFMKNKTGGNFVCKSAEKDDKDRLNVRNFNTGS
jgi:hypothetical protein